MLDSVRGDRNAYNKQLIQLKDDTMEQTRKFSHLNHKIQQIKQEISDKDHGTLKRVVWYFEEGGMVL